jgi:predicted kinase
MTREARAYLTLASTVLSPAEPRLVAIGGLSGTGKTSLAQALAPTLGPVPGARIVRSDVLRKRAFGVAPETRLPPKAYDRGTTDRVYRELCGEAAEALAVGYAVIADAVFLRPDERQAIAEVARSADTPFTGLWLEASPELLARRIAARTDDASDADVEVMRRQLDLDPGTVTWTRIDAGQDAGSLVARVRDLLASR